MKHIYVFYGPPGSGKGTIVEKFVEKITNDGYVPTLFEMGETLRDFTENSGTIVADVVKNYLVQGKSIPGVIASYFWIDMLINIKKDGNGSRIIILEGVIRTQEEAILLVELAKAFNVPVTIFELASSDEVCMKRLYARNRHDDKMEDIIKTRLITYRTTTTAAMKNLFNKLQEEGVKSELVAIDASMDGAENVWAQVETALTQIL